MIIKIPSLIHCHENADFMQKNFTAISFHFKSAVVSKQQYFCPDIVK